MRACALGCPDKREHRVDHRLQPALGDERPHRTVQFVGKKRLELRGTRPQRRPGQRQPLAHDLEDRDRRLHAALHGDGDMAPSSAGHWRLRGT